jgi:hypothetical protein
MNREEREVKEFADEALSEFNRLDEDVSEGYKWAEQYVRLNADLLQEKMARLIYYRILSRKED